MFHKKKTPQSNKLNVETVRKTTYSGGLLIKRNKSAVHKLLCVVQTPPRKIRSVISLSLEDQPQQGKRAHVQQDSHHAGAVTAREHE